MLNTKTLSSLAAGCALALLLPVVCRANVSFLVSRVPESANALVMIDVKKVLDSKVAEEGGWKQQRRQLHEAGTTAIPVGATSFVTAAQIDYEYLRTPWEVSLAQVPGLPSARAIAEFTGGRVDRLGSFQAVERPNDTYVVRLGSSTVGAMAPANRQQVLHWIQNPGTGDGAQLSPILKDAVATATSDKAPIVIALDTEGVLAPEEVTEALEKMKFMQGAEGKLPELIAGFRGAELRLRFDEAIEGELRLLFSDDTGPLVPIIKTLLVQVLANNGAAIDSLAGWKAAADGHAVVLTGKFSTNDLRRVLNIVSGPASPLSLAGGSTGETDTAAVAMSAATREYFQTITGYLDDLLARDEQIQSLDQVAFWVSRYADAIEHLSSQGVDDEAAAYAGEVIQRLREIVSVVDRAQSRADIRDSAVGMYRGRYARYGAWGYYEKPFATRDRELIQAGETLTAADQTRAITYEIRDLTETTRESLNERYRGGF